MPKYTQLEQINTGIHRFLPFNVVGNCMNQESGFQKSVGPA